MQSSTARNEVNTTYDDPHSGESVRIQEITPSEVSDIRNNELATVRYNPQDYYQGDSGDHPPSNQNLQDYDNYATRRRVTRERYVDDRRPPPSPRRRRRNSSPFSAPNSPPRHRSRRSSRDRDRDRDYDRRRSGDRRARSLSTRGGARSMDQRADDFLDKHFDSSLNGLVAAAAGAGIGAYGARKLGKGNHHRSRDEDHWRTLAGGVAGAAAVNAGEKRWRESVDGKRMAADGGRR